MRARTRMLIASALIGVSAMLPAQAQGGTRTATWCPPDLICTTNTDCWQGGCTRCEKDAGGGVYGVCNGNF